MKRVAFILGATLSAGVLLGAGAAHAAGSPAPTLQSDEAGRDLAVSDARRIAPKLEQYYFAKGFARDIKAAKASMEPAGQKFSPGNTMGGYLYLPDEEEFILCVQHKSGAWATYDTAPMASGANGVKGGCPKDLNTTRPEGGGLLP
ncbi:MAG: hypothetical protein ACT4QF_21770 [Sporichthyaceae bacterium]